jgi:FimV-like protein
MTRPPLRCWLISLLLGPTCALALEVGEIQVQSALNQLFDATIPLPTLTPEELGRISVKVASPPMFEEFGLDRTPTLSNLIFSIQYDAEGRVYVKVVSTQPIREPSLALLLEFGWPRGKTFREFTVLLDPVRRLAQRPSSRTKTVLNTPDAPSIAPVSSPAPTSTPVPAVAVTVPEIREPATAPLPVEAPSTTPAYKPGDVYGPVIPGEGLWGIALKIRPEGITREQMMQALFQANPQAFSSAGMGGLKIGARLRMPTYREIADFTGSSIAQRLATVEEHPAIPVATDSAPPPSTPEVFPLTLTPIPEPVAITETPMPAPVIPPIPSRPVTEPVVAAITAEPEAPKVVEPVTPPPATTSEPEPEKPKVAEPVAPSTVPEAFAMEPVSATPLLSLVISEILADEVHLPIVIAPEQTAIELPVAEPPMPVIEEPSAEPPAPISAEKASDEPPTPVVVEKPTVIEEEPPVPVTAEKAPIVEEPLAAAPAPISVEKEPVEPPVPVTAEKAPIVEESPTTAELPNTAALQLDKVYKGGDQYGPVSNNERLWDIATKVRPDPNVSRDVMMKALFLANPQAFTKPTMDYLKTGSVLRIPTLQEIVEHTGSTVAKSLLEQQSATESRKIEPEVTPVD